VTEAQTPTFQYMRPLLKKPCKQADRVRSLCYNERTQEIAVVSLNGFIHCWNAVNMKQVSG
jgi:WD repeat-containing protein 40A